MNEIYARRASQAMMMHQAFRMLPTLWNATQLTKEKLDANFVFEEFMRVNGHQQQHLLLPEVAGQHHYQTHWHWLHSTLAWAESSRAYSVRQHTPMTQRCADVALLQDSVTNVRTAATGQALVLEHIARQDGIFFHEVEAVSTNGDAEADTEPVDKS